MSADDDPGIGPAVGGGGGGSIDAHGKRPLCVSYDIIPLVKRIEDVYNVTSMGTGWIPSARSTHKIIHNHR
jgi:hypothetical protein